MSGRTEARATSLYALKGAFRATALDRRPSTGGAHRYGLRLCSVVRLADSTSSVTEPMSPSVRT